MEKPEAKGFSKYEVFAFAVGDHLLWRAIRMIFKI
jgi:hypothetical protein